MPKVFLTPGTTSWPGASTNGADITIECVGPGGHGIAPSVTHLGCGGGGGAYATAVVPYVANTPVTVVVPAGGAQVDTNWNAGVVIAKAGVNATDGVGGTGGQAAACTPSVGAFSGASGGGIGVDSRAGAGGGGAAGPNGDGKAGGDGGAGGERNGAGGGGAGGGASTAGGISTVVDPSGAGGIGQDGTAGGVGVSVSGTPGNPGLNGSGASGGAGDVGSGVAAGNGGAGGAGIEFDLTHGAGGGGGGGGGTNAAQAGNGGAGGLYGGGGGGGGYENGLRGDAAGGLIVITYTEGTLLTALCDDPPTGFVGVAYSHTFTATGGDSPYSFAISAGALPTGLSLASSGVVSGTPTVKGLFTFTVQVTDESDNTDTVNCSIRIAGRCLVDE